MGVVVEELGAEPGSVSSYDACWMKFSRDVEFAWVQQEAKKITPAKTAEDESAALACATEEGLGVSTIAELRELDRSTQRPQGDVGRCITIATQSYDPNEYPPIKVE